jgi:hypothetical protein
MDEDDTETDRWQSRIIGPQVEVFVSEEHVDASYTDYRSFERATMKHAISVPSYRLDQFPDSFSARVIEVGTDNEERVQVLASPTPYTQDTGLVFGEKDLD